ncbi:prephenate dehydratase domain-containing protein [Bordetella pertussis]|uniref:prephenate dehydratase domain-containing protein n=1 Tax=Bordetella pertussis TaxID=520 RepID=UPI003001CC9A
MTVAYLGPQGSFSEQAALEHFGHSVQQLPCPSFDEVFRAVEAGQADVGMVPVENSTEGAVNRSLDLLLNTPLTILGERSLVIRHCLMSQSGTMDGIKTISAHPQALAQCQGWLTRHYPDLNRVAAASNSEAARVAAEDPTVAAIAGEVAAGLEPARRGRRHPGRSAEPHALPGCRPYRAIEQRQGQDQPDPGRAQPRRRRL